jgi:hypothetical protein
LRPKPKARGGVPVAVAPNVAAKLAVLQAFIEAGSGEGGLALECW